MINCPKCQVPNPDNATACMACGEPLASQQFAQALDQAQFQQQATAPPPQAAAPYAMAPGGAEGGYEASGGPFGAVGLPVGGGVDAYAAQAEINQFMADQRARKRKRVFVYGGVFVAIAAVIGFFVMQGARKKAREEEVVQFFEAFSKIDDGDVGNFWKCLVRAKGLEIHKASDSAQVTDGLTEAFKNFPKSQPGLIMDTCVPMLANAQDELGKLKPPEGFAQPIERYKTALNEVRDVLLRYARKIDQRKKQAADEQELRNAHADFHRLMAGGGMASVTDTPKAVAYFNILKCAIPDLEKQARKVTKAPDTQYVVETIYNTCKADKSFADKLRVECFGSRNESSMRSPQFRLVADKLSGDDRDLYAINDCLERANHGFAFDEIKAVAEVFGKYRNEAKGGVLKAVTAVKEELGLVSEKKPGEAASPAAAPAASPK